MSQYNHYGDIIYGPKISGNQNVTINYGSPSPQHQGEYCEYEEVKGGSPAVKDFNKPMSIEEAIKVIMEEKDSDGKYIFQFATQWQGIYRVLVDYMGWSGEYRGFCKKVNAMMDWRKPCSEDAIKVIGSNDFRKPYKEWKSMKTSMKNEVFCRTNYIADRLVELLKIDIK